MYYYGDHQLYFCTKPYTKHHPWYIKYKTSFGIVM
jgi:hypothetical protein